jgi:hypothetical protein
MNSQKHIQDELKELNSSLPPKAPGVYSVPEGYFEGFARSVLERIKASEQDAATELENLSPLLASLSRKMPFAVPQGYFEASKDDLSAMAGDDPVSSVLDGISRAMPYAVPEGYFESLPQLVLGRVAPAPAKVVSMPRRWMLSAVAAAVSGILLVSGYFYMNRGTGVTDVENPQWVAQKLKNVDSKELEEFIKTTDINNSANHDIVHKPQAAEVKTLLEDVSDNELKSFLDQVPTDDEDLLMN